MVSTSDIDVRWLLQGRSPVAPLPLHAIGSLQAVFPTTDFITAETVIIRQVMKNHLMSNPFVSYLEFRKTVCPAIVHQLRMPIFQIHHRLPFKTAFVSEVQAFLLSFTICLVYFGVWYTRILYILIPSMEYLS